VRENGVIRVKQRIWEIDFARGIAIMLMVGFHLVVDLREFYQYPVNYMSGAWFLIGKSSAILFLLLAGISSAISEDQLRRGCVILGWGLVITVVTYLYNPHIYIRFGILHLIGSCLLIHAWIKQLSVRNLFLFATIFVGLGGIVDTASDASGLLIPLGISPAQFATLDYYPLFPWGGIFFWGVVLGRQYYACGKRLLTHPPAANPITYMGRHSLMIYLIHQPILLMLLYLLQP
jgi:uncharacterized membrane protein